jgi:hypothetical protein
MFENTGDFVSTNEVVDSELKAIHNAAMSICNREEAVLTANPTSVHSVTATKLLARQTKLITDSALLLMEDARQPLNVLFALLRTCLEGQARAIHITSATGTEREKLAGEFVQLMQIHHEYYSKCAIQLEKDATFTECQACDRPDFEVMKSYLRRTDTSNLKGIRKRYEKINLKWNYFAVTEQDQFQSPASLNPFVPPPLQLELHLAYLRSCSFMYSDPAALKRLITPVILAHKLVIAEVISISCFFAALGKEDDQDLINIKTRAFNFEVK